MLQVSKNFASNSLLVFQRRVIGNLRPVLQYELLSVGCFPVKVPNCLNQFVPRTPMSFAILSCVDCRQLPLLSPRQRLYRLHQVAGQSCELVGRPRCSAHLPKIGTKIEVLCVQTIVLAHKRIELFRGRKVLKLRKMIGKFSLVLTRERNVCAVKVSQFPLRKRQWGHCGYRSRNPTASFFLLCRLARSFGGGPGLPTDNDVTIFIGTCFRELVADFLKS